MKVLITGILLFFFSITIIAQEESPSGTVPADSLYDYSKVIINEKVDINCMVPPVGFDTSRFFNGYLNLYQGGMIRLAEYQGMPFSDYQIIMEKNASYLEESKMKIVSKDNFILDTGVSLEYIKVQYSIEEEGYFGKEYYRFLVYTGNQSTLFIDIAYPTSSNLDDAILKSLKTINYSK